MNAPILIAGAGPVGLSLGLALSRRGFPVQLFERQSSLGSEARASTWHPPTLEMLAEWGVLETLLPRGFPVDRLQYWDRAERRCVAEFSYRSIAEDTPFPFRFQCPQHQVTPVLLEALRATGRAEIFFDAALVDFEETAEGVRAAVEIGGRVQKFRGALLCGADGAHSAVRRSLGIETRGATFPDRFLLVSSTLDLSAYFPELGPVAYLFDPDEWVITMRLPDRLRIVFRLPADADAEVERAPARVHARIERLLGEPLAPLELTTSTYSVHQRVAERFGRGRVWLLGDAAHLNNPAGGMGMNSGIHDAHRLARAIVAFERDPSALEAYGAERRQAAVESVHLSSGKNYRDLTLTDREARSLRNQEFAQIAADPVRARAYLLEASMLRERTEHSAR